MLLAASYFFYGWWDWRFLGLIGASTVVDYFCAHAIARSGQEGRRRALMALSVGVNLTFLGFFKYFNFFSESLAALLRACGVEHPPTAVLNVLLPPGISFYTFQAIAYIVDVYRKKIQPADSLVDYALFISLFPHLIAGPIQNPSHLLPQVQRPRVFDSTQFLDGLMLIVVGLFRKCVSADNCATLANAAFNGQLGPPSGMVFLLGIYAFVWQLYGDFSGYSDIARGSAQLLGFHFMVNFRQPFLAVSCSDVWRRWHISLMLWIRDYLFIPLGGTRAGESKTNRNIMINMIAVGLWHGASWSFAVWGVIHGFLLCIERRKWLPANLSVWMQRVVIFNIIWLPIVFFRAESFSKALAFYRGLLVWTWDPLFGGAWIFLAAFSIPLLLVDLRLQSRQEEYPFQKSTVPVRYAVAAAATCLLILFTAAQGTAFIYFQF